ncbi:hypothetical protein TVAG_508000 [Trichomonas vaginalis G3]|uniref:Uncharacterized protein n=1 Tax=Trichomonas vaginalis (strain ATCC PRA-98 / G3) TaxID=412133 RepID=A2GB38_TRIV3|nr:hypothetical protein TVAGG3_0788210 [Trichomonas vaginalis G3]EAX85630.1 hypothetical protein TVAG_508000 [Trichomonas vaginalis G3]KAI5495559.1 hypothetical protein TVAGG3_0788210 [Trichomonas vaginalis G3]|eukprot:XP_001298560.1 hypothetical protein [Trichomonas vaginalis G3]
MILNEKYEPPWWLPLRNSLVMRIATQTTADIKCFELYTTFRMKQNPEEFIEILRFLGIFKSQRSKLFLMLSMWKGNSVYFDYQFYVLSRLFQSYEIPCPKNYIDILDRLHRHYLVTLSLFWQNRFEKNPIKSFVFATKCAFTHTELINLSKYLMFVYQYDANVANAYSEIALIAMGKPLQSVIYRRYATKLYENPGSVVDPIFRRFSNYYPISSEAYNIEISSLNEESKSENDNASSTSRLRFHFDNKSVIYRDEESDNSPMAMFVQKSNRLKRFSIYFSLSFAILWSIIFSRNISLIRSSKLVKIEEAKRLLQLSAEYSVNLTACFIVQPILSSIASSNLQNFQSFNFLNGLQNY